MDYERIEKKQKSMISPTKLRMKLMGPLNNKKKEGSKSNSNSSRTSPSRLQISDDTEFSKNSLLASKPDSDDDVAASTTDIAVAKLPNEPVLDLTESDNKASRPQQFRKGDLSVAPPHIVRHQEDENLDYDSNASSSSFEFHRARGERNNVSRAYPTRQMPSKWNDAEKWIMNRQNMMMRKNGQGNRVPVRVVPDNAGYELNKSRMDQCQSSQIDVFEKFPNLNSLIDQSTQSNDLVDTSKVSSHDNNTTGGGGPMIRSVCMRDMGTDMTPIPSQEPSRSVTPVDATTPLRSPTSSLPSTPRGGKQEESSLSQDQLKNTRRELSEEEMKAKTRREIVALGVKLGKMNIAAWASKEEKENNNNNADAEEALKIEFDKRAMAWEEAEKSKHNARYKREEIRIQAWESQERAKLEAEMRRIEAKVEQMKAEAEAKMVKKIAMAKQRSEEKRASAEARKARDAEKAVAEAQYIRETGRISSSGYKICCGWFS
ncbi:Remorin 4.1 [Cardamine amara subsp. amara]|uniref:Remorin 4.1 n=1 Tax=Cardamine amara subsp. amara TaxID=228776 RepID=A0ABD1AP36_CARAN